jgi:hypothetical protein
MTEDRKPCENGEILWMRPRPRFRDPAVRSAETFNDSRELHDPLPRNANQFSSISLDLRGMG